VQLLYEVDLKATVVTTARNGHTTDIQTDRPQPHSRS